MSASEVRQSEMSPLAEREAVIYAIHDEAKRLRVALESVKDHANDCGCGSYEVADAALRDES